MEILLEIPEEKVKELNIIDAKISFDELQRKIALKEMIMAMQESQQAVKGTEMENWTMTDINNFIQEAKDYHAASTNSFGY